MSELQPIKLNDPPYLEEQEMYGVRDKQAYIKNASLNTKTIERRSSKCFVCPDRKRAILSDCETRPEIGCNCCEECRKDCYLAR